MLKKIWNFIFGRSVPETVEQPSLPVEVEVEAPVVVHIQKHKVSVYKDAKGEWRWKISASNNRLIASSSESYKNRKDAVANVNSITSLNLDLK